ncbi:MAG: site-specific integrase [Alphaproteobacteria bacterium HGW-Alphaproteobacteria-13]|jgi:integrase|nr:MAG: site-specific integrase [Alphaproteobacteria bacterium HGW-Alphaproteobacteria-13]
MPRPIPKKGSPHWHYDFVRQGRRFHGSTGTGNKRLAQQIIDEKLHEALLPTRKRPPITLDDAAGRYEDYADKLPSWKTTEYILKALVTGLGGGHLLSEITQPMLIDHFAKRRIREDGALRANSSINREIEVASALWNRAKNAKYDVGDMPDWQALRYKAQGTRWRLLDVGDQQAAYLDAVRADVRDAVEFLLLSGWRRSEVLGLGWNDLDITNRTAWTRIKGGDLVERPLTQAMLVIIANQPKVGPKIFTYVCKRATASGGRRERVKRRQGDRYPLSVTVLREAHEEAREKIGATDLRLHDLRHTRATRILRQTRDLALTKRALAHRNIATTLKYAHVLDDDVRAGLDASESRKIPEADTKQAKKA